MVTLLPYSQAVDIGHGRGRLAATPAASLWRVDSAFGRPADINEAWRSPEQADANYRAYQRYLNGGPWAPIAFPASQSIHCRGYAVDTDDTADWQMRVWNDHGWFWTVYRNGQLVERWHLEYFENRDNHRGGFAGGTGTPIEEDDMYTDADRARDELIARRLRGPENRNVDMLQSIEGLASETRIRVRGDDPNVDILQNILGQITALRSEVSELKQSAGQQ